MADSRCVTGSVSVEHDNRFAAALKRMEKVANHEYDTKSGEQKSREHWLNLYVACVEATYRRVAT